MKVILEGGNIYDIFREIDGQMIVNAAWFQKRVATAVLILQDLGYTKHALRIDGRVYRAWVHPQCRHPKVELDVHLRQSTWEKFQ